MTLKSRLLVGTAAALALGCGAYLSLPSSAAAPSASSKAAAKTGDLALKEAQRGEWSRWRGPNGDGISAEKGLLSEWPEEGPPLAWQASGFGGGRSSVAISGGRIFTMGNKDGKCNVIAADVKDGSILWSTPFSGGDPHCTPTVDGDLVFGLSLEGDLVCCETKTGKLVWQKSMSKDFGGRMHSGWGFSESPLVDGDLLICTPGGDKALLAALNKKTGKVVWQTEVPEKLGDRGGDGAAYSSIVISHAAGVKQYVTLVGRGMVGVDAKTGKLLWHYNEVANGTANIPTPIVQGDYVFCSSGYNDGGTALLKISKNGKELTANEEYYFKSGEMQNHHGGMILLGDYVYMGHGHNNGFPLCVDLKTGKDAWRIEGGAGRGSAAIVYADGHFYFRYEDGIMALIEATPKEYRLKGKFKIKTHNAESWPHPVIAGGKLYLRDQNDLLCYDIKK